MSRHNKKQVSAGQMAFDLFALAEPDDSPLLALLDHPTTAKPATIQAGFVASSSEDVQVAGAKAKVLANLEAIRILYGLEAEGRAPIAEEMEILARYSAFGGTPKVFDESENNPEKVLHEKVKALLAPADYKSARAATTNAFYTNPEIIKAMWQYLGSMGFTGGRVLEPSAATGLFIAGMPRAMREASEITAVELEPLSGRIGKALHPDVQYILKGLQEAELSDDYFDLAISNIPFGDYAIFDSTFSTAERKLCGSIHNYFFLKAVKLVRPGGLIAFVTSRYMLDAKDGGVRNYLSQHCRLIGAVRMPSNVFTKFSGTDVVTDIVFFQKLKENETVPSNPAWLAVDKMLLSGGKLSKEEFWINRYYITKPKRLMGELLCRTGAYAAQLYIKGDINPDGLTERIIEHLPICDEEYYQPIVHGARKARISGDVSLSDLRNGSYGCSTIDGKLVVYQKVANEAIAVTKTGKTLDRLVGMIRLVAYARNVLTQCLGSDDEALVEAQAQLNENYDKFVAQFGCLNDTVNRRIFADDPNATFLLALELYDAEKKVATKTRLFTSRTIRVHTRPTSAATASDALAISLNEYGSLNMPFMVELYGKSEAEIIDELGVSIYYDPARGVWLTGDEYLSGNVVQKLKEAVAANDPALARNIEALTAIQPERLIPEQISAGLGSTWIPAKYVQQFIMELVDPKGLANHIDEPNYPTKYNGINSNTRWLTIDAKYVPILSKWVVTPNHRSRYDELVTRKWGTSRRDVYDLLESALNGTEISIYDKANDVSVFNPTESIAAREKAAEISNLFRRWAWMDKERSADLCRIYNDTFRCLVERTYDGSYLTFPNTSLDLPVLHAHQRNAIARAMLGGNMLLWHAVGAGKSWTMIIAAMEMKRLGLRNKPVHVVPGHLLEQYAVEFYRVYPNARILVINSQKMSPQEKQVSLARIAVEDWDSVLITHGAFQRIPLSVKTWEWLVEEQVNELQAAIDEMKNDSDNRFTVKKLEAKKFNLEARLLQRQEREKKDKGGVFFEDLGIDMMLVDECFPWETKILTDKGWLPIGHVVDNKLPVKVLTKNLATDQLEWKPIVRWLKREGNKQLVKVIHEHGEFTCTEDHKIWTRERGYVKAKDLSQQDTLCLLRDELRPKQGSAEVLQGRVQRSMVGGEASESNKNNPLSKLPEVIYQEYSEPHVLQRSMSAGDGGLHRHDLRFLPQNVSGSQDSADGRLQRLLLHGVPESGPQSHDYQNLPAMQRGVFVQVNGQNGERGTEVLLEAVRSDMATGEPDNTSVWWEVGTQNASVRRTEEGNIGSHEGEQSIKATRSSREDAQGDERANVFEPWWELANYDDTADVSGGALAGGVYGVRHTDEDGKRSISNITQQLQSGHSESQDQIGNRGGWELAQESEMAILGQAQNSSLTSARLVRIEVLEPRGNGQPGGVRQKGEPVYDIEVADNHNFFAEGTLVSNCHTYKSLYYFTARTHLSGIGGSDAGIAYDMFVKSQYVTRRCTAGHILGERSTDCACGAPRANSGSIIGATGTAITNSISEMFTLQRYFQMDTLIATGIDAFDAWAAQFGTTKWVVEMEASGRGWRTKERFIEFVNVPELLLIFNQIADICIDPKVLKLKRPAILSGGPKPIEIKPSAELLAFIDKCAERAEQLKNKKPWEDNMLSIMGDSSRAATDLRLVNVMVDHEDSKINTAIKNVFELWKDTSAVDLPGRAEPIGLTQLVFLDVGVPGGSNFPLYQDMKDKWVALGIPPEQIAFAHDANTDVQKKELYNRVNAGRVRIIVGTTGKLGAGVNMQKLLFALHHIDAPWTPALMEQREGRIHRPGNLNPEVWIFRYTVSQSLDFHKWHLLELKAAANAQLFTGNGQGRTVEDLNQAVIDFAQMRAIATGNPMIIEQVHLRATLAKLHALHTKYHNDRRRAVTELNAMPGNIEWHEERISWINDAILIREKFTEKPDLLVQGKRYEKRGEAAERFQSLIEFKIEGELLDMGYAKVYPHLGFSNKKFARVVIGPARFDIEMGNSGIGNLLRIDNEIDAMPKMVQQHKAQIATLLEKRTRLEFEVSVPFTRLDEMQAAEQRLDEINAELARLAKKDDATAVAILPVNIDPDSEEVGEDETEESNI